MAKNMIFTITEKKIIRMIQEKGSLEIDYEHLGFSERIVDSYVRILKIKTDCTRDKDLVKWVLSNFIYGTILSAGFF